MKLRGSCLATFVMNFPVSLSANLFVIVAIVRDRAVVCFMPALLYHVTDSRCQAGRSPPARRAACVVRHRVKEPLARLLRCCDGDEGRPGSPLTGRPLPHKGGTAPARGARKPGLFVMAAGEFHDGRYRI